ncbi:bidirectional hydrogenase complex protein HoxU family protein [delta proteobacterium NaphS2]|nr:bidirectional hydrogenase complex protein HoxU family protein [delta proteobacterium NaphS2]
MIEITIDQKKVKAEEGQTVLQAALNAGIYIPYLCHHPEFVEVKGLSSIERVYQGGEAKDGEGGVPFEGCMLCLVEIEGQSGLLKSCEIKAEEGMQVRTDTEKVRETRQENIAKILEQHPHACLVCAQADGCDQKICSLGIPENERCCSKYGICELQKVAEFIGIEKGLPPYVPSSDPIVDEDSLFKRAYDLCIGCLRCVRVCREIRGADALAFTVRDGRVVVGSNQPSLKESGCKYCGVCVEVCPTGALLDGDVRSGKRKKSSLRLKIKPPILPPEQHLALTEGNLENVPEGEGIYILFDEAKEIYKISGVENIREALLEEMDAGSPAAFFNYEEDPMFTGKERQLTQQYMKKHGEMPPGNSELDDLF